MTNTVNRWIRLVAVGICLLPTLVLAQDTSEISKRLKAAEAAKDWPLVERLAEQLVTTGNRDSSRRLALLYLLDVARTYRDQGHLDQAEARAKRALELCEQAGRPGDLLPSVAKTLGSIHRKKENYPEALRMYQWALITYESKARESDDVALTLSLLGDVRLDANQFKDAELLYRRALAMTEKLHGERHLDIAWRNLDLAWMYRKLGDWKRAELHHRKELEIRQRLLPADDPRIAESLDNLADALQMLDRYAESEAPLRQALAIREKSFGTNSSQVAHVLHNLGDSLRNLRRFPESESLYNRAVRIFESSSSKNAENLASVLESLARQYREQSKYEEEWATYKRVLEIQRSHYGDTDAHVAQTMLHLGRNLGAQKKSSESREMISTALQLFRRQPKTKDRWWALTVSAAGHDLMSEHRFGDAEELFRSTQPAFRAIYGDDNSYAVQATIALAEALLSQSKYGEAETFLREALRRAPIAFGDGDWRIAEIHQSLGRIKMCLGRFAEADAELNAALKLQELHSPEKISGTLLTLASLYQLQAQFSRAEGAVKRAMDLEGANRSDNQVALAELYLGQCRFGEAEKLCQLAFADSERDYRPDHPIIGARAIMLGRCYLHQDRMAEAEALFKRALSSYERAYGLESSSVAYALRLQAILYQTQGKFVEAEWYSRRSLAITEKVLGAEHCDVGNELWILASILSGQERTEEAEKALQRAIGLHLSTYGESHNNVAGLRERLGWVYFQQDKFSEAETQWKAALDTTESLFGKDHYESASIHQAYGEARLKQKRFDEAHVFLSKALQLMEKALGLEHRNVANCLMELARLYVEEKKYSDAEPLIERVLVISSRGGASFGARAQQYALRARIAWEQGRRNEGIADLREALRFAEQQRGNFSGAESDRSKSFGGYSELFERMVRWQCELGDVGEAVQAIEMGRARSLLDEMGLAGADIDAGRPLVERDQLRQQEQELRNRIANLEQRIASADTSKTDLQTELGAAREALYQHYRDTRSSNPTYRSLLSVGSGPPRLSQIQRQLVGDDGLLLMYLFGAEGGYVVVIGSGDSRVLPLSLSDVAAKQLGAEAGPLTAEKLQGILVDEAGEGVVQQLVKPQEAVKAVPRLAALWMALVPTEERKAILSGKIKRLLVVPDGPLAQLPLETLVVKPGAEPVFLLDAGPPIVYAPSATVLYNLAMRSTPAQGESEPVLSVGDPQYKPRAKLPNPDESSLAALDPESKVARSGKQLVALPHSGVETDWVALAFQDGKLACKKLKTTEATEANLRRLAPGRKILHLACHGLTDQNHGNFFGALALTPSGTEADNDGYLTLPEIYSLKLRSCELAILSACETNYGPQHRGEGSWALSRGFLVAGARRIVASNWLVDDEAAAHLVNAFCTHVAAAEKEGRSPSYAEALRDAKRWVRQQEKWQSPYYWGTFVLVGPN